MERKISIDEDIFIVGEVFRDANGNISVQRPSNYNVPFVISNAPNWHALQHLRGKIVSLYTMGTVLLGFGVVIAFSDVFKSILSRYWRDLENTDLYRISYRTISTDIAISREYRVSIRQPTRHTLDAMAILKVSGVSLPDQAPASIQEVSFNTFVVKYLFPINKTTYRRNLFRFISILGFSVGVVSVMDAMYDLEYKVQ